MEDEKVLYLYGATDKGQVREENQDAFRFEKVGNDKGYAVLCDGMGGAGGGWASKQAVEVIGQALSRAVNANVPGQSMEKVMESAVSAANAVIRIKSEEYPEWAGMGTTAVMVAVLEDRIYYAHVGDSRLYYVNRTEPQLTLLTKDHSLVQQWVDLGQMTPEQARCHPKRNMITRAIGIEPAVEPEYGEYPFQRGRLLLCSDGLYQHIKLEKYVDWIMTCSGEQDAFLFIDEANKAGGNDNISAVILSR